MKWIVVVCLFGNLWPAQAEPEDDAPEVAVQVLDAASGKPVANAVVELVSAGGSKRIALGANGEGPAPVPDKELRDVKLRVVSAGYISRDVPFTAGHIRGNYRGQNPIKLFALPGEVLSGRVLGPDGAAVPGARIRIHADVTIDCFKRLGAYTRWMGMSVSPGIPNWTRETRSDAQGRYQVTIPVAADLNWVSLLCEAADFAPREIDDDELRKLEDIAMSKGVRIKGRVVDAQGQPRAGVSVTRGSDQGRRVLVDFGVSDAEGSLREVALMPGQHSINKPAKLWPEERRKVIQLDQLELPYEPQKVTVPEGGEPLEVTFKALPDRLVQFDWDERREGQPLRTGLRFHGVDLMNCEVAEGVQRMCARLPAGKAFEAYLMRADGYSVGLDYRSVFSFRPTEGQGFPLAEFMQKPILLPAGGGRLGTITAESGARIVVRGKGRGKVQLTNRGEIASSATGRFGQRPLRSHWAGSYGETFTLENLFPGETISFVVSHEEMETISGKEESMQAGETREREIKLVALKPKLRVSVYEERRKLLITDVRILVGVPQGENGELKWYREAAFKDDSDRSRWWLHKGYGMIKLKFEADGYESYITDWIDGDMPSQWIRVNMVQILEQGELEQIHLSIARAEALNMAIGAFVSATGRDNAIQTWAASRAGQEKYDLLRPYLAFPPEDHHDYMPDGYSIGWLESIETAGKLGLTGPRGQEPY